MRSRSTAVLLLISLRPEQWTKNLIVFAGALFGGQLTSAPALGAATGAFLTFCALSGAVYLFNDVADRAADQRHPLKRERPIASGELSPGLAATAGVILGLTGVGAAFAIRPLLGIVAAAYLALLFLYSFVLKHLVIIDALTMAYPVQSLAMMDSIKDGDSVAFTLREDAPGEFLITSLRKI
jgi:4-hydroxybenzoate polyprenyltransferase